MELSGVVAPLFLFERMQAQALPGAGVGGTTCLAVHSVRVHVGTNKRLGSSGTVPELPAARVGSALPSSPSLSL